MAAQFQEARVVEQPTQPEAPIPTDVFSQGASVFGQQSSLLAQAGAQQAQRAEGYYNQANSAFDRAVDQYNKIAVMNAQDEAPGLIKKDGNGQIIPPTSFWPSGIHSMAYAQAYSEAARATYRTMAASEFSNFVSETQAKYPTDPAAFKAAVDQKQQAMLQNLDPREAPFISLRLQQIASQGSTQVAVNLQAANNNTLKQQSDVSYAAIVDTASRQAGINAPTVAFGGKANPAAPGTISSITNDLPPDWKNRITSADRTPEVNKAVGGVDKSHHLTPGTAVDIGTAGMSDAEKKALVQQVLANPNLRGIGFEKDHIHIDTGHDKHTVWGAVPGNVQADVRTWQGTPTSLMVVPTTTDVEKLKTQLASSTLVAGMLADWEKQVGPIKTPGEIARMKDELAYKVIIKSYAESIKKGTYDDGAGHVDQGKVQLTQDQIEKTAAVFPGREADVRQTLNEALQYSVTRSSRFAAQQQLDDQRKIEPAQRRAMDLALQADALKNTDVDGARRITDQLRQEARDALRNTSLNDAAALQLAQTYYSTGNMAKASFTEGLTNKIQGMAAVEHDPTAGQDQKAQNYESARAVRNTPELYGEMNAGQRSYLQGVMDDHVKANYGAQLQAYNTKILEGNTSPAEIDKTRAEQIAQNKIPLDQITQTGLIDIAAKKAWREKQTQSQLAAEQVQNFNAGRLSTPEQIAAHKAEVNWKPPNNMPSVDYNRPDDRRAVKEFYQKYGYLPDLAKSALNAMTHSPDEAAMAPFKEIFDTIRQVERQRIEKVMGTAYDKDKEAAIAGNVAAVVGDNYSYLAMSKLYDAPTANKLELAYGDKGKAGATGMTADQAKQNVGTAVDGMFGSFAKRNLSLFGEVVDDVGEVLKADENKTQEQKALQAASDLLPNRGLLGNVVANMTGGATYDKVEVTPELRDYLTQNGVIHLANDGNAIRTVATGSGEPEKFVANTAFFTAVRNGEVEARRSEDGKTLTFGYKSLGGIVGPAMGVQMTPRMEQFYAAGLLTQGNILQGRDSGPINPDNISTRSYRAYDGQMRILIAQRDRNGNIVQQEDIARDDPRISLQALSNVKAATQAIIAQSADPATYGKILMAGAVGSGPGAIALLKDGDITGNWIRMSTMVGNTVQQMQVALNRPDMIEAMLTNEKFLRPDQADARKNAQIGTQKLLQDLDAELKKIPDAPSAKAVLSHMIENHAPAMDSSALRQMIKDSGFYQPGRLPQSTLPVPPTSRIGTEKP